MIKISKYMVGDKGIWFALLALMFISFPVVFSASGDLRSVTVPTHSEIGDEVVQTKTVIFETPIYKHICFVLIAIIFIGFMQRIPPGILFKIAQILIFITWVLLIITLVGGKSVGGARRWLVFGPITVQTSEIAKIAIVMYFAQYLSFYQKGNRPEYKQFIHLIIITSITCVLIITENFSSAFIIWCLSFTMMIIGRVRLKYISGWLLISIICSFMFFGSGLKRAQTWQSRIYNYTNIDIRYIGRSTPVPWIVEEEGIHKLSENDHVKLAIYNGGLNGVGNGNSKHKDYLGAASSDYIYSIIIEEQGIKAWLPILLLYLFIIYRSAKIMNRTGLAFRALLVAGCVFDIVIQAFLNMLVGSNTFPITGQTLPFISMGGTSMILNSAVAIGMILSVSYYTEINRLKQNDENLKTNIVINSKTT